MKLSSALSVAFLAVVMSRIVSGGIKGVVPRFPLDGCNGDEFWHKYEDYCYKLVYFPNGEPGNVFDISAECQNQGPQVDSAGIAYLADIQSRAENDFIANMVTMYEERAWIGAFRFGELKELAFAGNTVGAKALELILLSRTGNPRNLTIKEGDKLKDSAGSASQSQPIRMIVTREQNAVTHFVLHFVRKTVYTQCI
ncbi:hypothetical protein HOLleu_30758 [Holothuria leucospilota]|uniref:Uncharacterized protein n=1 Tax=Holothuria leucospilota TaxID=206669 RepID=A0A9Q1BL53_HOLLE|nr:hypothetical protein HOLleu_30758 [Holothuria leucospilota]